MKLKMEMHSETLNIQNIKLYKYRWVIITLFALYGAINFFQFMQFTIIADSMQRYYKADAFLIDMSGMIYLILFLIFFIPAGSFVENTDIRLISLISSGLTAIGNCIKIFATSRDKFYLVILSQSVVAIAQMFMLIIPSKIASVWFGPKEVSTACSIGVFGTQLGLAIGTIIPAYMIKSGDTIDSIEKSLNQLFIYNGLVSVIMFFIVLIFFRSHPPTPPSLSQAHMISSDDKITFLSAIKQCLQNKDFLIIIVSFGISFGVWNAFGIIVDQIYTHEFPNDNSGDLGLMTFLAVIFGGCVASLIFGYILDKISVFKWVCFLVLLFNLVAATGMGISLMTHNKLGMFISVPTYGFFSLSLMVLSYEYTIETTYPMPISFGASIINAIVYIFGILFVIILDFVFGTIGYVYGYILVFVLLVISTVSLLFISKELRRRNANIGQQSKEES